MNIFTSLFRNLRHREPVQVIGVAYGVAAGVTTFIGTLQGNLLDAAPGWGQFVIVLAATLVPLLQGKTSRETVDSPATVAVKVARAEAEGAAKATTAATKAKKVAARKAATNRPAAKAAAKKTAKNPRKKSTGD